VQPLAIYACTIIQLAQFVALHFGSIKRFGRSIESYHKSKRINIHSAAGRDESS